MKRWTIYCHTSPSGHQYIGQTALTMDERWVQHCADAGRRDREGCRVFWLAIRKYGRAAFTHEILDVVTSQEGANIAERVWIEKRGTLAPNGYNLDGGGGAAGFADETLQKMSKSALARWAAVGGPKLDATLRKMSDAARRRWAALTPEEQAEFGQKTGERMRKWWASLTPEEIANIGRQRAEKMTPEQRGRLSKVYLQMTPQQRSEVTTRGIMAMPPEARRERSLKGARNRRAKAAALKETP